MLRNFTRSKWTWIVTGIICILFAGKLTIKSSSIAKGLKCSSISSEWLGPPKGFQTMQQLLCRHPEISYTEIFPSFPPPSYKPFPFDTFLQKKEERDQKPLYYCYPPSSSCILQIPQGRVYGDKGTTITPDDYLLEDTFLDFEYPPIDQSRTPIFKKLRLETIKKIKGSVGVLAGTGGNCYFHWIFDILPKFELLRRSGIPCDKYYINNFDLPYQKETLKALGIKEEQILWTSEETHIKAENLVVPCLAAPAYNFQPWVFTFLRESFLKNPPKMHNERIYISRKLASRKILNEDEVMKILSEYGFREVCLEKLPFDEQVNLFASAEMIVAPHGAGLTNLVFCSKGVKVVEIFALTYPNPCFFHISQLMGFEHHCFSASQEGLNVKQYKACDSIVNCEELRKRVEQCIASFPLKN